MKSWLHARFALTEIATASVKPRFQPLSYTVRGILSLLPYTVYHMQTLNVHFWLLNNSTFLH